MNPRCDTCRYWWRMVDLGFCRRYPPVAVSTVAGTTEMKVPKTRDVDWCGEHREKERS